MKTEYVMSLVLGICLGAIFSDALKMAIAKLALYAASGAGP